jgi:hypothetical protein
VAFQSWDIEGYVPYFAIFGSAVTVIGSLYVLARDKKGRWGATVRILPLVLGIASIGFAIYLNSETGRLNDYLSENLLAGETFWRALALALWGLALFLEGCYFLWHWKDWPAPPRDLAP